MARYLIRLANYEQLTRMKKRVFAWILGLCVCSAIADEVTIVAATATETSKRVYRFDVTLKHADNGWDHYADSWEVIDPSGQVLGKRTLYHPHVDEQPFTRSLSNVEIPAGIDHVMIRAHDKVHGESPQQFNIELY